MVITHQINHLVQRGQHAKPQEIKFHEASSSAIIFVPLQDTAITHACPLHRAHLDHRAITDHHATGMNTEMSWGVSDLTDHFIDNVGMIACMLIPHRFQHITYGRL